MWEPKEFEDPKFPHHVCKLHKAIYELKQAPRACFERLRDTLIKWGFYNTKGDTSLFISKATTTILIIIIYVDDIPVKGSDSVKLKKFTARLNHMFALKYLANIQYFLGLEIKRADTWMFISQKKYILDLLSRFNMENSSECPTPMVARKQFTANEDEVLQNPTMFRRLIDALQYVTNTRTDIGFSINKLSRFLSNPTLKHWQAAKRIQRYLKRTSDSRLHLKPSSQFNLIGYCDADWGVSHEDRRPIVGYCVYLGNSLISLSQKRQLVFSRSSIESEYRAIVDLATELTWVSSLLKELQCPVMKTPVIWSDNISAGSLALNLVYHSHTKHVEIDIHFKRDKVAAKEITMCYVPLYEQTTDCLTKALTTTRFAFLRNKLGVIEIPSSLRRGVSA